MHPFIESAAHFVAVKNQEDAPEQSAASDAWANGEGPDGHLASQRRHPKKHMRFGENQRILELFFV